MPLAAFFLAGILALAAAGPAAGDGSGTRRIRNHFDSDAPMRPPAFLDFEVLAQPGVAEWMVLTDFNPPSWPSQVTQTQLQRPADSIAAALRRGVRLRDGAVSVAVRSRSARGGLVFRVAGPGDFLALLVDSSGGAVLTSYRSGKASELARGTARLDQEWGILSVALAGEAVSARWNGRELLAGVDPAPAAGRVGLATAGPGAAAFDELIIESSEPGQ